MLCQYPSRAGVTVHLRFFYVYGCRFANLGLWVCVTLCRSCAVCLA